MSDALRIRSIEPRDYPRWRPLWQGYNAFYGRTGPTALPEAITESTWRRFFESTEPVHALVAEEHDQLVGLVHYLYHRSTTALQDVCYLQDLFTVEPLRGRGIGRQLIQGVYEAARTMGCGGVYWQTHLANRAGRLLYDRVAKHEGYIVYDHALS